jgi:hypothetical protein
VPQTQNIENNPMQSRMGARLAALRRLAPGARWPLTLAAKARKWPLASLDAAEILNEFQARPFPGRLPSVHAAQLAAWVGGLPEAA